MNALSIEQVKSYFEQYGCEFIEDVYINSYTKITYRCSCGNITHTTVEKFKNSKTKKCKKCCNHGYKNKDITIQYLKKYFRDHGCILLETEFKNFKLKLNYICKNGHTTTTTWNHFREGKQCRECYKLKQIDPNKTDEERLIDRDTPENYRWIDAVHENNEYTCQCCGRKGDRYNNRIKLNAHHLYSYSKYPDKRFEVANGVTLCEDCHKKFHKEYGYIGNTKKQYIAFMLKRFNRTA